MMKKMTTTKERLKRIAQAIENERMSSVTIANQVEEAWKQGVHDAIRQVRWRQGAVSKKLKPLYDELVTVLAAMAVRGEYELFSQLDSEWVSGPYVDAGEGEGITFEKAEVLNVNPIFAEYQEHLVKPEDWFSCGAPEEAMQILEKKSSEGLVGLANHPKHGWAILVTGNQPFILWAERNPLKP